MKKNQVSNYRSVFLKSNGINKENAMPVAISPKTYAKIEQIIQVMGDGSCTVDDFVENVLKHGLSGKESRSISISAATYDMIEGLIHGMETDGCTVDAFVESILKYQLREANTRPYSYQSDNLCRDREYHPSHGRRQMYRGRLREKRIAEQTLRDQ